MKMISLSLLTKRETKGEVSRNIKIDYGWDKRKYTCSSQNFKTQGNEEQLRNRQSDQTMQFHR